MTCRIDCGVFFQTSRVTMIPIAPPTAATRTQSTPPTPPIKMMTQNFVTNFSLTRARSHHRGNAYRTTRTDSRA